MTREEVDTILEALRAVTYYSHEIQYDRSPEGINEKDIGVLNAIAKGLVKENDNF